MLHRLEVANTHCELVSGDDYEASEEVPCYFMVV